MGQERSGQDSSHALPAGTATSVGPTHQHSCTRLPIHPTTPTNLRLQLLLPQLLHVGPDQVLDSSRLLQESAAVGWMVPGAQCIMGVSGAGQSCVPR